MVRGKKIFQNQEWLIFIGVSLLVILLRFPSLEQPFDNDSGANAYHARLIVRGEPLYSTHHPAHHLPAVYYTYALAFLLFGDSVASVKFLLILWMILSVYLLYRLGVLLIDGRTGILAAVFYAILSSHLWLWGPTAEIELFANLPRIGTILILMQFVSQQAAPWRYFFVGLLLLTAFMFKAVYILSFGLIALVLVIEIWRTRKTPNGWRYSLWCSFWLGLGFITGLGLVLIYFGGLGLLSRFFLVFTLGQRYVNLAITASPGLVYWLIYPFVGLAVNNAVLLSYSLAGLVIILLHTWQNLKFKHDNHLSLFYIAVWYILSLIEANASRIPFFHYYLLIVPPLALLAAWLPLRIYRDLKNKLRLVQQWKANLSLVLLIGIPLLFSIQQNFDYYQQYIQYKLGSGSYHKFLLVGGPAIAADVLQVETLANYLQQHTSPTEYIYYWSESVQLYYLIDRRCPIDITWPLYAEATGSYKRIFEPQTKYIIVSRNNRLPLPTWFTAELSEKYRLETVLVNQEIYRRYN